MWGGGGGGGGGVIVQALFFHLIFWWSLTHLSLWHGNICLLSQGKRNIHSRVSPFTEGIHVSGKVTIILKLSTLYSDGQTIRMYLDTLK